MQFETHWTAKHVMCSQNAAARFVSTGRWMTDSIFVQMHTQPGMVRGSQDKAQFWSDR